MDENSINQIMNRAKTLINMDSKMDAVAKSVRSTATRGDDGEISFMSEATQMSSMPAQKPPTQPMQTPMVAPRNSKLPKEIIESMMSNPINVDGLSQSLADPTVGALMSKVNLKQQEPVRQVVNETVEMPQKQEQPLYQNGPSSVDYSLIKSIIEETVRKYMNSAVKKLLKELGGGNDKLNAMMIGDKFNFISENGDLYEATLNFKKNVKTK